MEVPKEPETETPQESVVSDTEKCRKRGTDTAGTVYIGCKPWGCVQNNVRKSCSQWCDR